MSVVIVIPARYGSTRFPGKPLHKIAGKTLLEWVLATAYKASSQLSNCQVLVATDDQRIASHVDTLGGQAIMTPSDCPSGSDRVLAALETLDCQPDCILNCQGDVLFTPAHYLTALVNAYHADRRHKVLTPAVQLSWQALDDLRSKKKTTPFSGTTVVRNKQGNALWFSKQILPAIRTEPALRKATQLSPVYQHIGIYAYTYPMLSTYVKLQQTEQELNEGLEQLRFLENGYPIHVVTVRPMSDIPTIGIDSLEDAKRAEKLISAHGELVEGV